MNRYLTAATLVGALALTGSALADPQPSAKPETRCFHSIDWNNWSAPDEHSMYVRVGVNQIYRMEFSGSCPTITWPNAHLITQIRGGDMICSPVDIDLKVSTGGGMAIPCIVSKMTELTPAEIAAVPKKQLP